MIEVKVPVLPESISEATVVLWHKKVGDVVRIDDVIAEVETDKVVLEIPSAVNGIIEDIIKNVGSVVGANEVLAYIKEQDIQKLIKDEAEPVVAKKLQQPVGPSVRKMMTKHALTPEDIAGSGKKDRILKDDVIDKIKAINTGSDNSYKERFEERVPLSSLRKAIVNKLLSATQKTAMLTTFNELDMSAIIDIRKKYKDIFAKTHGIKLGFMSFFVKAAVEALKKFPAVNAYIDADDIVYHGYCDIGVAVSSKRGLVVPILRDVHKMSLHDIESSIVMISTKAQNNKLSMEEITGGTFTISNGGVFGSMLSTPILNTPQSAILGMHNIENRAVVVDNEIVIRPIMYLALSYDHRIIDGREAVLFLRSIKDNLQDPNRLLLNL